MVRKFYSNEENTFSVFVQEHPTRAKGELQNKLLSRAMMKCRAEITQDQVNLLLPHKHDPLALNPDKYDLNKLIDIDFEDLVFKGDPDSESASAPIY